MTGRPKINLDPFKADLVRWFQSEGFTYEELSTQLYDVHHVRSSPRTLKTKFKEWSIIKRVRPQNTDALQARITYLFYVIGLDDQEILDYNTRRWTCHRLNKDIERDQKRDGDVSSYDKPSCRYGASSRAASDDVAK